MGKHEIRTEIEISATAERIWAILADFGSYSQWNPFVKSIEGKARAGAKLRVAVKLEGGRGMTFRPTVLAAIANRELRWRGGLLIPGLFNGEHYFRIEPSGEKSSRFIHGEEFSGLLVPLFRSNLEGATKNGFSAMNRALKGRAEG